MPQRVLVGFSNGERKRLQTYLEDENVELDSFDLHGVLKTIKKHKVSVDPGTRDIILNSVLLRDGQLLH